MQSKQYYIYILTNKHNTVLYVGVTGRPLPQRVYEHRQGLVEGFTKRYNVEKLVYFEVHEDAYSAITREKQLKAGSRERKVQLIETNNPGWKDLYDTIV